MTAFVTLPLTPCRAPSRLQRPLQYSPRTSLVLLQGPTIPGPLPLALGWEDRGGQAPDPGTKVATPHCAPAGRLTGTGMQGLGSHDQRRAHGVEGKFLKVVAGLLGEDLVDHESLVAPPGCFELAGRAQPQLCVAVHGEPGRAPAARGRGAGAPAGASGRLLGDREAAGLGRCGGEPAPGARAARLDPPADQHLRRAFWEQCSCQSARASRRAWC